MYPKISLIFFFALVIIIHGKDKENAKENANNNAAPCTDETNFGKDRYCMLEYGRYANKTALLCDYPGATYYGVAKVLNYKFVNFFSTFLNEADATMIPEEGETAYASAYLMPLIYFKDKLEYDTVTEDGRQSRRYVKVDAEVTLKQKTLTVECNLDVANTKPQNLDVLSDNSKPFESDISWLKEVYRQADMPEEYLNYIGSLETKPDPPSNKD